MKKIVWGLCLLWGTTSAALTPGKEYQRLKTKHHPVPKGQPVPVVEFFNYACPACFHLEKDLETWLASKKPGEIAFSRNPVVYHEGWDAMAKTYFVAKNLKVLDKVTPATFHMIHKEKKGVFSLKDITDIFLNKAKIEPMTFMQSFSFAPQIGAQMMRAQQRADQYEVFEVPTLVINGEYKINTRMVDNDTKKFFQTVDLLIEKAHT